MQVEFTFNFRKWLKHHVRSCDETIPTSVTKNLMHYRFNSAGWGLDGMNAEIHSFPTMYIMGGVYMTKMGKIGDFVPKIGPKSCFFRDTNLVLPTLGGSGTPKF